MPGIFRQKTALALQHAMGFVEKLHQHRGTTEHTHAVIDIDGKRRCRVDAEKFPPLFPWLLFDQIGLKSILGKDQANKSRGGRHGMVVEGGHRASAIVCGVWVA
ncbi:hypothetical protein D3C87_1633620 [compost metagenome]